VQYRQLVTRIKDKATINLTLNLASSAAGSYALLVTGHSHFKSVGKIFHYLYVMQFRCVGPGDQVNYILN
jgi:hypothetical protein